jgi:hypothetical protein
VDANGDAVVTGVFYGTADFGAGPLDSAGGDAFLAKYAAANGSCVWSKRFGGGGGDTAVSVAVDSANNIVFCGGFSGSVNFGGISLSLGSYGGIFLVKVTPAGDCLWANQYGGVTWTDMPVTLR